MKRWRLAFSGVFVWLGLLCGLLLWLRAGQLEYKTRWDNRADLEAGILSFNTANDRLPGSLAEVVESGHLPERGTMYFSPILHPLSWERELSYLECEYELLFEEKRVAIQARRPGHPDSIAVEKVVTPSDGIVQ